MQICNVLNEDGLNQSYLLNAFVFQSYKYQSVWHTNQTAKGERENTDDLVESTKPNISTGNYLITIDTFHTLHERMNYWS